MAETTLLTRDQEELLAVLVAAQRKAGDQYTEGFRAPLFLGKDRFPLRHRGLPEDGLEVNADDLYTLQEAGFVTILRSGFTRVLRIDLTPAGVEHIDRAGTGSI